jgi:hypothetical protein
MSSLKLHRTYTCFDIIKVTLVLEKSNCGVEEKQVVLTLFFIYRKLDF